MTSIEELRFVDYTKGNTNSGASAGLAAPGGGTAAGAFATMQPAATNAFGTSNAFGRNAASPQQAFGIAQAQPAPAFNSLGAFATAPATAPLGSLGGLGGGLGGGFGNFGKSPQAPSAAFSPSAPAASAWGQAPAQPTFGGLGAAPMMGAFGGGLMTAAQPAAHNFGTNAAIVATAPAAWPAMSPPQTGGLQLPPAAPLTFFGNQPPQQAAVGAGLAAAASTAAVKRVENFVSANDDPYGLRNLPSAELLTSASTEKGNPPPVPLLRAGSVAGHAVASPPSSSFSPPERAFHRSQPVSTTRSRVNLGLGRGGSASYAARVAETFASSLGGSGTREPPPAADFDRAPSLSVSQTGAARSSRGGVGSVPTVSSPFSAPRLSAALENPVVLPHTLPVPKRSVSSGSIQAFRLADGLRRAVESPPRPNLDGASASTITVRVKFPTDIDTIRLTSARESADAFSEAEQLALAALNAVSDHEFHVAVDRTRAFGATAALESALYARRSAAERALAAMGSAAPAPARRKFSAAADALKSVCPLSRAEAQQADRDADPFRCTPLSFFLHATMNQDTLVTEDDENASRESSLERQGVSANSLLEIHYDSLHVHARAQRAADREFEDALSHGGTVDELGEDLDHAYERACAARPRALPQLPLAADRYSTRPSAVEIMGMTDDELRSVRNFAVYRYPLTMEDGEQRFGGSIEWFGPVDLLGEDVRTIVQIGPVNDAEDGDPGVDVYPLSEYSQKPRPGEKLNSKARVTLLNIFPEEPGEQASLVHEDFLRQLCRDNGTEFVEWNPHGGAYVFDVENFGE